ncbi:type II secretion system protein [bacterium]|nr:type II secretion system protein [bacterium]
MNILEEQKVNSRVDFSLPEKRDCHVHSVQLAMTKAFTLAEVLITLGIIGIVAAMTLPALISNYKEKTIVSKLKKFESIMSQAFLMSIDNNGTPDYWGLSSNPVVSGPLLSKNLVPYLNVMKNCELEGKCFYNKGIKFLNGNLWANLYNPTGWGQVTFTLSDGSMVAMNLISPDCSSVRGTSKNLSNVCAFLYVDVNGPTNPNVFGRDFFSFYITKYGIIPNGTPDEFDANHSFAKNCIGENANGMGCTAWVLYNENMDYLHCPNKLGWNKSKKCN